MIKELIEVNDHRKVTNGTNQTWDYFKIYKSNFFPFLVSLYNFLKGRTPIFNHPVYIRLIKMYDWERYDN